MDLTDLKQLATGDQNARDLIQTEREMLERLAAADRHPLSA